MQLKFVNRSSEFSFLEQQRTQVGSQKAIVMVCGESGVGKSELTKKFIEQSIEYFPSIKLSIPQAEKNAYSSGYYIIKLARQINSYAHIDSRINTLARFFRKGNTSEIITNKVKEHAKEDLSSFFPFSKTAKGFIDLMFGTGEFDEKRFFESTHSDALLALFEYIQYECTRNPLIINIENIQSIDERSLELLLSVISTSNNSLYVLEYTDNDATGYSFSQLTDMFETLRINISPLFVHALNIEDVKKIIHDQPNMSWELIQSSYVNWKGNIRLLVDVMARMKYGLPSQSIASLDLNAATREHLKSLKKNELFLLTVIHIHKEPVQKSILKKLVVYKEAYQYVLEVDSLLESLDKHYLLKFSGDEIMLAHDSIADNIEKTDQYEIFCLLAQKFWLDTYNKLLQSGDTYTSRGWRLMKVLYFASLLNLNDRIFELLEIISEEALLSRDAKKMISYVEEVKSSLIERDKTKYHDRIDIINYWLTELWYKLGYSKEAFKNLEEILDESPKHIVLKAILYEQVGKHDQAIGLCNRELDKIPSCASNYELAIRLVKLVTHFDKGELAETKRQFFYLYNNTDFSQFFEYGFLLRNAELIYDYRQSLPYYLASIHHFERFGAIRQAAFSRITYGVHLGLTGQIEVARNQFELASKELGNVISERHTLLNNLAVLLLFQRQCGDDCETFLRQSMLTADSDFEKVTITMNYLVMLDWMDRRQEAEASIETLNKLLKQPSFANKEIIRYVYFDIYKYYSRIGNNGLAAKYREKIDNLQLPETPIWRFWLYQEAMPADDEEIFLSIIDRAISFMCNWNMEYDSFLMRYE